MDIKKIKKEFDRLGFNVTWKKGIDGQGWYIRKYGESTEVFIAFNIEQLGEKLIQMKYPL